MKPIFAILAWLLVCVLPARSQITNAFFAMDTGTRDAAHQTPMQQVQLLKELGFAGVGPEYRGAIELRQWLTALDQAGLKLFALYVPLRLDSIEPSLKDLTEAARILKGHDSILWLYVTDSKHSASSAENDEVAVDALKKVAALAQDNGLRVALYPHTGFYVQRVEDAARLAAKANCPNLGVTFNLCHWLMVDGKNLETSLKSARPYLFLVAINGADNGGKNWDQLIQPLDRGSYDVTQVLKSLTKTGYAGPIGLQHFGIKGDARENLRHSIEGWHKLGAPSQN